MSNTPKSKSSPEQDYFQRVEAEKLKKMAAEMSDKDVEEAAEQLRLAHWMHCAKCGTIMETMPFKGVEIERCPNCGGLYLDQGELEKLAGQDKSGVFHSLGELLGLKKPAEAE